MLKSWFCLAAVQAGPLTLYSLVNAAILSETDKRAEVRWWERVQRVTEDSRKLLGRTGLSARELR